MTLFPQLLLGTWDPELLPMDLAEEYHDRCEFYERLLANWKSEEKPYFINRNAKDEMRAMTTRVHASGFTYKQFLEAIRLVGKQRRRG